MTPNHSRRSPLADGEHLMLGQQVYCERRSQGPSGIMWLRYLGIVLPMAINYGFILLSEGNPNWVPLTVSAAVMAVSALILGLRGDWRGSVSVIVLFFPLNAWPIVVNFVGGLHD
jgi:hypothetical protein